jgi:hypothetical protein
MALFEGRIISKMDSIHTMQSFKKGQVVQAVWRAIVDRGDPPPPAFSAKIKKLAELGVPLTKAERTGHPGLDNSYTAYQAFELGVAVKLLDAGYKQGEVAILVTHIRPDLQRVYSEILESPPMSGMNVFARDRPTSPPSLVACGGRTELADPNRRTSADTSYWMTFRSVEFPQVFHPRAKKGDLRFEPQFHRGLEALTWQMQQLARTFTDDHRFVLELSNMAMTITNALPEIQPTQRGRQ